MVGMEIGSRGALSAAANAARFAGASTRARANKPQSVATEEKTDTSLNRERKVAPEVGFGANSVKLPGIAVNTLKRNLSQAEKLVPTVEESEAKVRERVEKDQERLTTRQLDRNRPPLDLRSGTAEAVNNAREFVSSINKAAGQAKARTSEDDSPPANKVDIRIGDKTIPYDNPRTKKSLDLLA